MKTYTIKEYQSFTRGIDFREAGFISIPERTFDSLEKFILENQTDVDENSQAWQFLSISVKRGQKVISAKNYVGLITMKDGTTIEILPKLENADDESTKRIFREMLKASQEIPHKSFKTSNVNMDNMPLLEIFIRMFLDEVGILIKRGLKFGYVGREADEKYLKGRLRFNQQIRYNLTHKERFYVEYDEFEANRPENKLIKSTLLQLRRKAKNNQNLRDCNRYLLMMADVEESRDYVGDFAKYISNRNMQEYDTIMSWCNIFLRNKSFSAFKGDEVAFALLFPMEKLFESFVAEKLRKYMSYKEYKVSSQDKGHYLFDAPRKFALRPDIVVTEVSSNAQTIMDTKWKMLAGDNPGRNYGISQSDMYQMYAYQKKYNRSKKAVLIYPYNSSIGDSSRVISYTADEEQPIEVKAMFFDLMNVDDSLRRLVSEIER